MRFKRGFSDPAFEQGGKSEFDRAIDVARDYIFDVLSPEFREELTEQQMKLIADQAARRVVSALDHL